jgi:addiction module HigA family antidote
MLLEEFITPLSMDRTVLAERLGLSRAKLDEIIDGQAGITADLAQRLESVFGMSATFWMNLQNAWDQGATAAS